VKTRPARQPGLRAGRPSLTKGRKRDHRAYSFWLDDTPGELLPRPALEGPTDVDVVIVGAGYTGLWTAYYLARADPHLRIAVIEKDVAGFGASGRNGGWVSPSFATPLTKLAESHGREAAIRMQRTMFDTVDEIGRVCVAESIDAQYHKGGSLWVSTSPAQTPRVKAVLKGQQAFGFGDADWVWMGRREVLHRVRVEGCLGGIFSARYASVQPARLVRGLAQVVDRMGVRIYEGTPALSAAPGGVDTPAGRISADAVILATEAYTGQLPGHGRDVVPIHEYMIATAPLPVSFWEEVGWAGREVLSDGRHLIIYAQRTADDRIAIGGTEGMYHFGSRIAERFERRRATFQRLETALKLLFPAFSGAGITHRWGGVFGATRDWHTCVDFDPSNGFGWAGGYVGDGVATANLAGRTLSDLILRRESDLTGLPWVHHRSKPWEREPLRWIGATGVRVVMSRADEAEFGKGREVRWSPLLTKIEEIVGW
jgi:glycine/D-amino acid oxidase-like deaminating enzyme